MKKTRFVFISMSAVLFIALAFGMSRAQEPVTLEPSGAVRPLAAAGSAFTYQGQLKKGAGLVSATCTMEFRLFGSEAGSDQQGGALSQAVAVSGGLFTVRLDFGFTVFDGSERWLGIKVQCPGDAAFADLGRQELTAVPYALYAAGTPFQNVIVVAKSGGDFTSIQAAIDSITDAAAGNAYLVWVAPGIYTESVALKPFVHLRGAGQDLAVINSGAGNSACPPVGGTLELAAYSSVHDLSIGNTSLSFCNAAIIATDALTRTEVANVTVRAIGATTGENDAIYLSGATSNLALDHVTALAQNAGTVNRAIFSDQAQSLKVTGGSFTAKGGAETWGIRFYGENSRLDLWGVTARAENGADNNALLNFDGQAALYGGSFTAAGGTRAKGIFNYGFHANLNAEGAVGIGESGSDYNYGAYNGDGATARLLGGFCAGRGGFETFGIYNSDSTLAASSVTALGEDGSQNNNGLANLASATATLEGGSFTGNGGYFTRGIYNDGSSDLEASSITALGESATTSNFGLLNDGSTARLHNSRIRATGGINAWGIYTSNTGSNLEGENLTVLGEGSASNRGLTSGTGGEATLTQSVFEGAVAIMVSNYSIFVTAGGGPVSLSNSRLVGPWNGAVSCVGVSRGANFADVGCP